MEMSEKREVIVEEDEDYESLPANTSLTISMLAGATAGIMEHTIMFPVDVIKTRMQVAGSSKVHEGIIASITKISGTEGARALWRGMLSMIVGAGPAHAIQFAVYENVLWGLTTDGHASAHPYAAGVAGALATVASDAMMTPFDVIKQRMQLQPGSSLPSMAATVFRKEGFRAFYISYPTTLIMSVPFSVVNFSVYDTASHLLNPTRQHDPLIHCISGGVAGASAAAVSTPLDCVKTLLQTRGVSSDVNARSLNSFMDAIRYIYRNDGLLGFFRGLRPRVVANMPSTAICWTVYEMAKFYLFKDTNIK